MKWRQIVFLLRKSEVKLGREIRVSIWEDKLESWIFTISMKRGSFLQDRGERNCTQCFKMLIRKINSVVAAWTQRQKMSQKPWILVLAFIFLSWLHTTHTHPACLPAPPLSEVSFLWRAIVLQGPVCQCVRLNRRIRWQWRFMPCWHFTLQWHHFIALLSCAITRILLPILWGKSLKTTSVTAC